MKASSQRAAREGRTYQGPSARAAGPLRSDRGPACVPDPGKIVSSKRRPTIHALRWLDGKITMCGLSLTWNPQLRVMSEGGFRGLPRDEHRYRCLNCERSCRS